MIKHILLSAITSLPTSLLQTMEHVFYYGICPINERNQHRPQVEVVPSIPILSGLHGLVFTEGIFERKLKNMVTANRVCDHSQQEMQQENSYLYGFYCGVSDVENI
jgi:hypothetical protein